MPTITCQECGQKIEAKEIKPGVVETKCTNQHNNNIIPRPAPPVTSSPLPR